jgi:hypothetical protein
VLVVVHVPMAVCVLPMDILKLVGRPCDHNRLAF